MNDIAYMRHAIRLAHLAESAGEVPVGAILVKDDVVIGEGWNRPIVDNDPTAHAEIMAIREAGEAVSNYRLLDTTLYVTLEPCLMCVGAMVHARVGRVVFGAVDPKRGAIVSALQLSELQFLNHQVPWISGVLSGECSQLLTNFFKQRR
ncbi:MAG: tRNA adenosine(34) deaminase TadA [Methylococcaceae bacterium]|nr:tRNA adenosine(34) deaminase TadA [Methylococcaceae bacterium]